MEQTFDIFLWVMTLLAAVVFVALYFVKAGYGVFFDKKWGLSVDNKLGWVLMESPVFVVMSILWWYSARRWDVVPLCFFAVFQLHYFQRSFIFPMLIKGHSRMPLNIMLSGVLFNVLNALMQGGWIFYIAPQGRYTEQWLTSAPFIIGILVFFAGMFINIQSDAIIRNLRKPGDKGHYLPKGGVFTYVNSANYFGELLQWIGFAVMTWSWAGAVFAWWTFANLAPRAAALYTKYKEMFPEEMSKEKRKRILPFIY
ncbi:MAG: DUF1295 domain-containing protein [Flavobacteriales bacterium]|nr:DUF1295 domain-containing protein [Flavobacteriales bacterium]